MAIITTLRTAVADAIDAADLAVDVETTRQFVNPINVNDLDELRVVVLPETLIVSGADLKPRAYLDWGVRVWVQQRFLDSEEEAGIPPLLELCEEISLLFRPGTILPSGDLKFRSTDVQLRPAFDPKMLDENGVFSSQIVIVFRLARE